MGAVEAAVLPGTCGDLRFCAGDTCFSRRRDEFRDDGLESDQLLPSSMGLAIHRGFFLYGDRIGAPIGGVVLPRAETVWEARRRRLDCSNSRGFWGVRHCLGGWIWFPTVGCGRSECPDGCSDLFSRD